MITHSLGSKIVADALREAPPIVEDQLTLALGRTYQVFMEANQIPILSIGVGPISAIHPNKVAPEPAMQALVSRIAEGRRRNRGPGALTDEPVVLVAFSDPNDLLSWGMRGSAVQWDGAKIIDVWVSNAATWFGAVENPLTAHVGYATNAKVMRLIACGWKVSASIPVCR